MANAIQIAARLYECRDTAKRIHGAAYHSRISQYATVVKAVSESENIGILDAAKQIADADEVEGITAIMVFAAAVEIVEPSTADTAEAIQPVAPLQSKEK